MFAKIGTLYTMLSCLMFMLFGSIDAGTDFMRSGMIHFVQGIFLLNAGLAMVGQVAATVYLARRRAESPRWAALSVGVLAGAPISAAWPA